MARWSILRSSSRHHRIPRGSALLLAGLVAAGPALGVAAAANPPAPTPGVVVNTDARSLHLSSVINARDVGGYRTAGGQVVKSGLVFRTAEMGKLSPADSAALTARRLRVVADLRTDYERRVSPDRIPAGATGQVDDVLGHAPPPAVAAAVVPGGGMYRQMVGPGANEAVSAVLHDIITSDGAVLFHCSAGKDRTGWVAAVLLSILGVDRATVNYDYLLSNYYRNAAPGDGVNGVTQPMLDSAFDQANRSYGSFQNYVREGLRLSDVDIAVLKAKLLF